MEIIFRLKNRLKHWVGRYPCLFFPLYSMFARSANSKGLLVRNGTEIIIEGFPRSANTFAVVAFEFAQEKDFHIAHHLHVEAQILRGVKLKLPVIVLIRHPVDAINSLMIMHPYSVQQYAKRYVEFYTAVSLVRKCIVLAEFREVTDNFGKVINRVNARFSARFKPFKNSKENMEHVFKRIVEINSIVDGGKLTHMAKPVAIRLERRTTIDINDPLIQEAIRLYESLVARAT
jgi:hypothetical protein